ncbi:hypothetical protein ALC62_04893 [Cyphomyrmex costatus]|uniref:Uncharacterized protein n=1 Tax=Cyphomyrmex costatus TaxID=456900 RepID=A0A195CTV9_9HYME|nr:hypothetical protein ALC62_04893 [Cyphomyrmex costatus]
MTICFRLFLCVRLHKGYGERQAVRTCRGADMTTGIQRRKSGATTLTKSAEWIT